MNLPSLGIQSGTTAGMPVSLHLALDAPWLGRQTPDLALRIVGVTGQLFLNERERISTRDEVRQHIRALCFSGAKQLRLLSGLAPGADLVATETALEEARANGRDVELVALLPGNAASLVEDWLARADALQERISKRSRDSVTSLLSRLLSRSSHVVDLCQFGFERCDRNEAYRRLGVLLADLPDVLIAVRHGRHAGQKGGTAEVLAWRSNQDAIPEEFRRFLKRKSTRRDTVIIDPSSEKSPAPPSQAVNARNAIRDHLKAGNALTAYDQARALVEAGIASADIRYLFLLSLAATGNPRNALDHYNDLAPPPPDRNEDWLSLPGRLYKDLAIAGVDAQTNFALAASEYEAAHHRTSGLFSGVNAATLNLLIGRRDRAEQLARSLLAKPPQVSADEQTLYFDRVSRAEAHLVLAEADHCVAELERANPLLRNDLISRSRTRQQLSLIAAYHELDRESIAALEMPAVYLITGTEGAAPPLPPEVARRVEGSPLFVTVDSDRPELSAAQACVDAGARVHLVLTDGKTILCDRWAAQGHLAQSQQLDRLATAAERVSVTRGFLGGELDWRHAETRRLAHGLARVTAAALGTEVRSLSHQGQTWSVFDEPGEVSSSPASRRRMVGLVFTDAVGFRRFTDEDIEAYWSQLMPVLSERISKFGNAVLFTATWGDAIHVVTTGASSAAELSLSLLDEVARFRPTAEGALRRLQFRVGAHYAPAFESYDPVERQRTYYGTQLSFAASVEPVTPPGMVYVTETFAAQLALEAPGRFQVRYAGDMELAKHYGSFRLHGLTRAAALARQRAIPQR